MPHLIEINNAISKQILVAKYNPTRITYNEKFSLNFGISISALFCLEIGRKSNTT